MKRFLLSALLLPFLVSVAGAQSTLFLVRHAEAAGDTSGGKNPDLSEAGRARAERLATVLKDAGIAAVFTTEFARTQGTAAPLARAAGVELTVVPAADSTRTLVAKLKEQGRNALVVGHSNTLPEIIKALGVSTPVKIEGSDFDQLFVVVPIGSEPRLIQLRIP